jgi:hypothetical protein
VTGGFAFLRTPFTLTVKLRGRPGEQQQLSLTREGRPLAEQTVVLDKEGRGTAELPVTPTQVGRFAYEVSIPVAPDDAVPGNNSFQVVVRVVRDRTRVLQVCGSPSYDQKFLRLFLKEDPSIDLVSFFILRTEEDLGAGWHTQELSLIQFPYDRLFSSDLENFDLVILQNFDYAPYFQYDADTLLDNLATYVRQGGALVMTGGDRSFDLGQYARTPLADVLPVELGVAGSTSDEAPFRPMLTAQGLQHPITRLAATDEESRAVWERLPELDGLNLVVGPKKDAAVLLQHPTLRTASGAPDAGDCGARGRPGSDHGAHRRCVVAVVVHRGCRRPRQPGVPAVLEERAPLAGRGSRGSSRRRQPDARERPCSATKRDSSSTCATPATARWRGRPCAAPCTGRPATITNSRSSPTRRGRQARRSSRSVPAPTACARRSARPKRSRQRRCSRCWLATRSSTTSCRTRDSCRRSRRRTTAPTTRRAIGESSSWTTARVEWWTSARTSTSAATPLVAVLAGVLASAAWYLRRRAGRGR